MSGSQRQDSALSRAITTITLVPEHNQYSLSRLPACSNDNTMTKLLYSKFIVKGVKPINHEAIVKRLKSSGNPSLKGRRTNSNLESKDKKMLIIRNSSTQAYSNINGPGINETFDKNPNGNRIQSAFKRSHSAKAFRRPQSAGQFLNKQLPTNHTEFNDFRQRQPTERKNRPVTATTRLSIDNKNTFQCFTDKNTALLKISDEQSTLKPTNYIERNKREASIKRIKKQNIYLTQTGTIDHSLIKNQIKHQKKQAEQQRQSLKLQMKQFKHETVTPEEKQKIKLRQQNYLNFMKENMPYEYASYLNTDIVQKENQQFISFAMASDNFQLSHKQVEDMEIDQYRQDYYNKCVDTQYAIRKAQRKRESPLKKYSNININEEEQLMSLYQIMVQKRQNGIDTSDINFKIKQMTQSLSFFKQLQPDMLKTIFQIKYSLMQIEENQIVIEEASELSLFYVILYGSVVKRNLSAETRLLLKQGQCLPFVETTLFDGQAFGLPLNSGDKTINYSIKTLEKCMFMTFPINSYKKALTNSLNIEDRFTLLDGIFNSVKGVHKMIKEDLLVVANRLQSKVYSSQQIVVREGQQCNELMIVASGRVQICFESIITRSKQNKNKIKKSLHELQPLHIHQLRRTNIKDYQLLQQNEQSMQYYLHKVEQQKQRGKAINWRGFHSTLNGKQEFERSAIKYSVISSHNNTRLFFLSPDKLSNFTRQIQQIIAKIAEIKSQQADISRNQVDLKQWEDFKQKICSEIIKNKQKCS